MNEVIEKETIKIENMIYDVRGIQGMLDSEISAIKCHYYVCNKIITYYDIGKSISDFNNFIVGGKIIWS